MSVTVRPMSTEHLSPLTGPAANFHVTLTEAARRLGLPPPAVCDLVRAGHLGALLAATHEVAERPPLRFCEESLAEIHAALFVPDAPQLAAKPALRAVSALHAVASALRDYLATRPPTDSAEVAESQRLPLLSKARSGAIYAHVRTEPVAELARRLATGHAKVRLAVDSETVEALRRLGCQQVRGVYPLGGGRQSWKTWWRVPLSVWSVERDDLIRLDDFPAFGGIRESDDIPGEPPPIGRPVPWREGDTAEDREERLAAERARVEREGPDVPVTPHRLRALAAVERGEVEVAAPGEPGRWSVANLEDRFRKGVLRACTQLFDLDLIALERSGSRRMVLTERGRRHLERGREDWRVSE